MAGLLQNRTRPSALEVEMDAMLRGQVHECPGCGSQYVSRYVMDTKYVAPLCRDCCLPLYPMWTVRNGRGKAMGTVAGATANAALESAKESRDFDRLKAFSVSPELP